MRLQTVFGTMIVNFAINSHVCQSTTQAISSLAEAIYKEHLSVFVFSCYNP